MKIAIWLRTIFYICVLGLLTGCSTQKVIINGLDERDANEIMVFLSSKGIEAQKMQAKSEAAGGGGAVYWNIAVDERVASEAMAILNANGLPRRKTSKLLDIFSTGGLVPSEMQEKIRYQAGLAEQIASTVRKIDGIIDADVQLSFPEEDPLNPSKTLGKVTASVFVKHNGILDDPNSHLIPKIRRLVASSVQGLDFDNVTIIADRARFSESTPQEVAPRPEEELVRVWTVAVAKDSVGRFQMIFTGMLILFVLGAMLLSWFVWRLMPVIREAGIIPALFSRKNLLIEKVDLGKEEEKKKAEESAKAAKEAAAGGKGKKPGQENIEP